MNCEETQAALSAADGSAAPPDAEAHLAACASCRAWALALEHLPDRLAEWTAPEPADGLDQRVLSRVRQTTRPGRLVAVAAQIAVFLAGALAGWAGAQLLRPARAVAVAVEPALDVTDEYVARSGKEQR